MSVIFRHYTELLIQYYLVIQNKIMIDSLFICTNRSELKSHQVTLKCFIQRINVLLNVQSVTLCLNKLFDCNQLTNSSIQFTVVFK